jgi:hypothetical protein
LDPPTYQKPYGDPIKRKKEQAGTKKGEQKVKQALTEVKMSGMCQRAAEADEKKTYRDVDRVTVLGLVCEKMTERVVCARQEEEDRRVRQEVFNSPQEESGDGEGMIDDDCFPDDREVWEGTHVCEEDVETTEGEGVDFLCELLDLSGWTLLDEEETEKDLS